MLGSASGRVGMGSAPVVLFLEHQHRENSDNIYYFKRYKTTMNASITLYIIALMALLSATTAFFGGNMRTKAQSRNTLKMASSYIQKLGKYSLSSAK